MTPKLKTFRRLVSLVSRDKKSGKKIVFTNGCFDILHVGHVRTLKKARALGDVLVVGLNSDRSVRQLKGAGRPLVGERERAEVLSALACVDHVILFSENTPERLIRTLRPDILVKGGDWKKEMIAGGRFVESYGGKVRPLNFVKGFSTTAFIQKVKRL